MKYTECLPENTRSSITCNLIKELGFDYELAVGNHMGSAMVYVIVSREPGKIFRKERATYCARINVTFSEMHIYGDDYKQTMIDLAQELEKRLLAFAPKNFDLSRRGLCVEFASHDTVTYKHGGLYYPSDHQAW